MTIKNERKKPTEEQTILAENQIAGEQKIVDYDTREYPVEIIVQKFRTGMDEEDNELFIPTYQRDFVWDEKRQSKFIESVMLGLPIPYIFTADNNGRLEIIDGSQRIRTLTAFLSDDLILVGMKKLTQLNGFIFSELPISRQRRFNRTTLRMIELTEKADAKVRLDIFERINTGSDILRHMEVRKGVFAGPFYTFVSECAKDPKFERLCPISPKLKKREEAQEMVLRFFAYADNYLNFQHSVIDFLNQYIDSKKDSFNKNELKRKFHEMLDFVEKYYPYGFRKSENSNTTPRVRFEALSVGTHLALKEKPKIIPTNLDWLDSDEFKKHTRSDASNSRPKIKARIEFVKTKLLSNK